MLVEAHGLIIRGTWVRIPHSAKVFKGAELGAFFKFLERFFFTVFLSFRL